MRFPVAWNTAFPLYYRAVDRTGGENQLRGINVRTLDVFAASSIHLTMSGGEQQMPTIARGDNFGSQAGHAGRAFGRDHAGLG
jgi:hypothetical protein